MTGHDDCRTMPQKSNFLFVVFQSALICNRRMQTSGYRMFLMRLGRHIQDIRRSRGLSQERLAELIDMDRVSIGYIEQARRSPKLSTLYEIARALDVTVIDLFDESFMPSKESRGTVRDANAIGDAGAGERGAARMPTHIHAVGDAGAAAAEATAPEAGAF